MRETNKRRGGELADLFSQACWRVLHSASSCFATEMLQMLVSNSQVCTSGERVV